MAAAPFGNARLSQKAEEFLARTLDALRQSGASEEELISSEPGLNDAVFAEYRVGAWYRAILPILSAFVTLLITIPFSISLIGPSNWEWFHRWKGYGLFYIVYFWFALAFILVVWKRVSTGFLDRRAQTDKYEIISTVIALIGLLMMLGICGYEICTKIYPRMPEMSIWDFVIVILCGAWVFAVLNIFFRIQTYVRQRVLAFFRPDCALIISLCYAFQATRNEAAWHDQTHRNRIARHLTVAADAVEKFMPQYIATQCALNSISAVRRRLKETAIPLRGRIVWLVTPGALTRTDLEAELRKAIIAASQGQLALLEEASDPTNTVQVSGRNWWILMADLSRAIAWAVTPLALVQIGSALQLPLLSQPEEQTAAQKAAYIWLTLAILRGLSPGNFKETIEAAGSLLGRSKPKGGE